MHLQALNWLNIAQIRGVGRRGSKGSDEVALTLNLSKYNSLHISNAVENARYADQIASKLRRH